MLDSSAQHRNWRPNFPLRPRITFRQTLFLRLCNKQFSFYSICAFAVSQLQEISVGGRHKLQHQATASTPASLVVKKRRKSRTAFTSYQLQQLERSFSRQKYLLPADRDVTARRLGLSSAQVITWFQNRRAKLKRDLEELRADVDAARSLTSSSTVASSSNNNNDNKSKTWRCSSNTVQLIVKLLILWTNASSSQTTNWMHCCTTSPSPC